jgi:hypothetical protein
MSLNEIAADLTCDPEEFEPATTPYPIEPDVDGQTSMPGKYVFPSLPQHPRSPSTSPLMLQSSASSIMSPRYCVHGGMLRMARAMGDVGKPVQLAVKTALLHNPGYGMSAL